MTKSRLEAFSDGVLAIIITIMVLELAPPHGSDFSDLVPLLPKFFSYVLSFLMIGIYWNNHHHLWQAVEIVKGSVLWANLHLLFWLSLVPFVTSWMGENEFASLPVASYGVVLWMAGFAYFLMVKNLMSHHQKNSLLATALGDGRKERISLFMYSVAIPMAFFSPWISIVIYVVTALIWLVPDSRIESRIFQ